MAMAMGRNPILTSLLKRPADIMGKPLSIFLRLIGLIAVGFVAWISYCHAGANILARQNPDAALALVGDHSAALAHKGNLLFATNLENPPSQDIRPLATRSLNGDLLNAKAVRLLAAADLAEKESAGFKKLIRLSERLSRREFMTQIYLVQEAARDNNVPEALAHFDIALKTNRSGAELVYAILTPLLADANIRAGLKPYIEGRAAWVQPFFAHATNSGKNPASVAEALMQAGGLPFDPVYPFTQGNIVNRLILENKFQMARDFYLKGASGDPSALQSIDFGTANTESRFAPISWRLASSPTVATSFEGQAQKKMRIEAGPEATEIAANKIIYLKPGRYGVQLEAAWGPFDTEGEVKLSLVCLVGGGGTVFDDAANARKSENMIRGQFVIPADCTAQTVLISVESFAGQGGIDVLLSAPSLRRL